MGSSPLSHWIACGADTTVSPKRAHSNGPQYTATASVLYAHELRRVPITTPAHSPESNGLAEGFVHTFKRDYVNVHELRDAAVSFTVVVAGSSPPADLLAFSRCRRGGDGFCRGSPNLF